MVHKKMFIGSLTVAGITLYLIMRCTTPLEPASSATKTDIILESSSHERDDDFIEDSLGNSIRIGITSFLPENIDSIKLLVTTPTGQIIIDTVFFIESTDLSDTVWKTVTFLQPGSKNITIIPYSSIDLQPVIATLYIHNRNLPENAVPSISVTGNRIIRPNETCSLTITVADNDTSQQLTVSVKKQPDSSAVFEHSHFIWTAPDDYTGVDTIIFIVTDNGFPPASDSAVVIIKVTANPHPPTLSISGDRTLTPSSSCVLIITQADEDSGQSVRTTVTKNPEGSSIIDDIIFVWEIPADFTGRDTIIFTTTDDGTPPLSTTDTVIIIVSEETQNFPPAWTNDTIKFSLSDRDSIDINLADSCSDADGDEILFSLPDTLPENDVITGSHYQFTPAAGTDTTYYVPVIAADGSGASTTCIFIITVEKVFIDNDPPVLSCIEPSRDSSAVNSPSISITISAVDASGIDSVTCSMGQNIFEVTGSDSFYNVIVTGLQKDRYNRIVFTAADASDNNNTNSLILYINYDPTMEDHARPLLRRSEPLRDSISVSSARVDVAISATDVSGISSVVCRMGTSTFEVSNTDSIYSAAVSGLSENLYNKIVYVVTDASTNANKDSIVFHVNYDPTMNDHTPPSLFRTAPDRDSSVSGSSTVNLSIAATDANGIASVTCSMGGSTFEVTNNGNDAAYAATVSGLTADQYNRILFIVTDGSTNRNRDSIPFHIDYDPTLYDRAPPTLIRHTPTLDSITVGIPSVLVAFIATDANGIHATTCSMQGTFFEVSNTDTIYSATVTGLSPNQYSSISFVATDGSTNRNSDSATIHIFYNPTMSDHAPPQLSRYNPVTDRSTVSTPSCNVSISTSDASGINSVECIMGGHSYTVSNNGPVYSAYIPELAVNQYNRIVFTVTDGSTNRNKDSIDFHINYDPTVNDHTKPFLARYIPINEDSTTGLSSVNLTIISYDASGIHSVVCTMDGVSLTVSNTGQFYSAAVSGLVPNRNNRIVFTATDGSTNANKDSIAYSIYYDPTINDHTPPTLTRRTPPDADWSVGSSSLTISMIATDANGIGPVVCTMAESNYPVTNSDDSVYSAVITELVVNQSNIIKFVVADASTNANEGTITFNIFYDPTLIDNTPPILTRRTPSAGDSTISTSSITISISAVDQNGINTVVCTMAGNSYNVTNSDDSVYSALVTGLTPHQNNRILFTAADGSTNANRDSIAFTIDYDPTLNDHTPPTLTRRTPPDADWTVGLSSLTISMIATDANGIGPVVCTMAGNPFPVANVDDSVYSATVTGLAVNQNNVVKFIAADASANANEDSIIFTIFYDPTMNDNTPPILTRRTPSAGDSTISTSSITISISAVDQNGINTVACSMAGNTYNVTLSNDSVYSATVTGLMPDQNNRISFVATDGSSRHNRDSLIFQIFYDPTLEDLVPPTFSTSNWPASNSTLSAENITLNFSVTDVNNIERVWWNLNGTVQPPLSAVSPNNYSLTATLVHPSTNQITVYATDNSTNHNQSSIQLLLNYNRPPVALSQNTVSTPRAIPISIALTAQDPDGDDISQWTIVDGPYNGSITNERPIFTYTPTGNYEGRDSLAFRVRDTFNDSSVAAGSIKITVTARNVAPEFITQPASAQRNRGESVTFTAVINDDVYPPPEFSWFFNGSEMVHHSTEPTYSIPSVEYSQDGTYFVTVSNGTTTITSERFTLTVLDRTPPTLTLQGAPDQTIMVGSNWTDPGATAFDDRDGNISSRITTSGNLDVHHPGRYTISYTVSDVAVNSSTINRIVRVEGWQRIGNFGLGSKIASVMTRSNKLYIKYMSVTGEPVVAALENEQLTPLGTPFGIGEYPQAFSMALDPDRETPYIAYTYCTSIQCYGAIKRWDGSNWNTIINKELPLDFNHREFIDLSISVDHVPYIAGVFRPANTAYCAVKKVLSNNWEIVGPSDSIPFDASFSSDPLMGDKNVVCIASNGTPYFAGNDNVEGKPIAMHYLNGEWTPAATEAYLPGSDGSPNNIHLLQSPGGDIYFGCTYSPSTYDAKIFRLNGNTWNEIFPPIGRNRFSGQGGFSMAFSGDNLLYAVHPENNEFFVRRWNGLEWQNIPQPLLFEEAAFVDNCDGVSIAAGVEECYVIYKNNQLPADQNFIIMHWKRQ